jgi:hypothetical protein
MKTIEAPKVDEKMVHDPFKKKKEKKTVIAKKGGWITRRNQEAWRFAKLIGRQRRPEDTGKEISRSSQEAR